MTARLAKDVVRTESLGRRRSVTDDVRLGFARDLAAWATSLAGSVQAPACVSIFIPIRGEPDTLPLIAAFADAGVVTALPATVGRAQPLRFHAWRPGEALRVGRFGVPEPSVDAPEVRPDLLLVPLAAFDRRGFRLGYGAGYYDATIAGLRRTSEIRAVGIAFAVQEVGCVPTEPHDEGLDAVLTENGLIEIGKPPCASSSSAT